MPYVTDTHSLIWHTTNDPRLSARAKDIFEKVDQGLDCLSIPCIVFFELLYLIEKKKIDIDLDAFIAMVSSSENYSVEPMCLPVIKQSRIIPREKIKDPWDRLIAATSICLGFPLITKDESLREIGLQVVW